MVRHPPGEKPRPAKETVTAQLLRPTAKQTSTAGPSRRCFWIGGHGSLSSHLTKHKEFTQVGETRVLTSQRISEELREIFFPSSRLQGLSAPSLLLLPGDDLSKAVQP